MNDTVHLSHLAYGLEQLAGAQAEARAADAGRMAQAASPSAAQHFQERKARVIYHSLHDQEQHDRQDSLEGNDLFLADADRRQQLQRTDLAEDRRLVENFEQAPDAADRTLADDLAGLDRYNAILVLVGNCVALRAGERKSRQEADRKRDTMRSRNSRAVAEMLLRVPAAQSAAQA